MFFEKIWDKGEGFNEIIINHGYPRLRVDLRFIFLVYSQHKAVNFLVDKFSYGCWNGGLSQRRRPVLIAAFLIHVLA